MQLKIISTGKKITLVNAAVDIDKKDGFSSVRPLVGPSKLPVVLLVACLLVTSESVETRISAFTCHTCVPGRVALLSCDTKSESRIII